MSKSAALGIIFLVEFGLGLWQFKPHGPTSTPSYNKQDEIELDWLLRNELLRCTSIKWIKINNIKALNIKQEKQFVIKLQGKTYNTGLDQINSYLVS